MRLTIILLLLITIFGCSEVVECLECRSNSAYLHTCEDDVLGWDAIYLSGYYQEHGFDTCFVRNEKRYFAK